MSSVVGSNEGEVAAWVHAAAELGADIFSILDAAGQLVYNSPAAERIHGYAPGELVGRNTMDFIHPEDLGTVQDAFARLFTDPTTPVLVTYRYRHRDGSWTWMEATGRNHLDDPRVRGIIAISRDISHRVTPPPARVVPLDNGVYDPQLGVVTTASGPIELTAVEGRLLDYLAARPSVVVPIERLLQEVWGYSSRVRSRAVYVAVARLRKKVERDPAEPRCIVSRNGRGYAYVPPGSA